MIVYIVQESWTSYIEGVYADRDKAYKKREQCTKRDNTLMEDYSIIRRTVK